MTQAPQYKQAFPDFDHDPKLPPEFVDVSWHNDAMPSWTVGEHEQAPTLYINYKNPELREISDMSACFVLQFDALGIATEVYCGDDIAVAIAHVQRIANELNKS